MQVSEVHKRNRPVTINREQNVLMAWFLPTYSWRGGRKLRLKLYRMKNVGIPPSSVLIVGPDEAH